MNDEKFQISGLEMRLQRGNYQKDWLFCLGLGAAALILFTTQLGALPLRDWDEGLVAQVAREIWQAPANSMTWLYPTQWGEPYFNKPTLVHCLIAITYAIGGVSEWTARFPGAVLTAVSVPLLYAVGREVFYPRSSAIFSALVYLTLLPVVRQGRLAMLDGAILCFMLFMVWCVLRSRRDYRYSLGVGLGFGLICLTKGVMVGVLLAGIAVVFIAWDTPRLLKLPYLWIGLLFGSVPVVLWYVAQWQHYGSSFLGTNLVDQSLQRIWAGVEGNAGPPWYYLLEIIKYTAPWLLFLPLAGKHAWTNRNLSWAKLALVWGIAYLITISLMTTKLPWYVLPLYPAFALIVGAQLTELWQRGHRVGIRYLPPIPYSLVWAGWFAILALAGWAGMIYFGWMESPRDPGLAIVLAAVGITMTLATTLVLSQDRQFVVILLWGTYLTFVLFVMSGHWVWELAESYPVKPVAALIQQYAPSGQPVYTSYPHNRPSLNFYSDRPVLPASTQQLKRRWRRDDHPFLLLDEAALDELNLASVQVKGMAAGWMLVTRE
ncbi:phospholipid carrier-dependent glycosyltransferase [filamentous cyanobacterium CCP2]|nr:phospholipid carrier-dependent glycosyltransferase [filamentous cyanobacterium CCP2]